jgi:hypothetical protein
LLPKISSFHRSDGVARGAFAQPVATVIEKAWVSPNHSTPSWTIRTDSTAEPEDGRVTLNWKSWDCPGATSRHR